MIEAFAAALLLGLLNTIADVAADELRLQAKPIYWLARIAVACYCVGGIIGARSRQLMMGTIGGLMIGALIGGAYQVMAPAIGVQPAIAVAWAIFWLSFGLLGALLHGDSGAGAALLQGALAAVLSGAFYLALANIWGPQGSRDLMLVRVATTWTAAFLPGFLVLFWRRL